MFTCEDVLYGISLLKNNKALGSCHLSAEVLKKLAGVGMADAIAFMFNCVVKGGTPASWNTLSIMSLYKKGSKLDPNNYRGLSVMHVFAKLYSVCVNEKLTAVSNERALRADT